MKGWVKGLGAITAMGMDPTVLAAGAVADNEKKKSKKAKEGGIASPQGQYQDYSTGAPLQADKVDQYAPSRFQNGAAGNGQLTQSPQGWDYSSPGVGEQYWHNQQQTFSAPGSGEQYWNQVQGKFNAPTRSGQVADAGVDAYFDRAAQKTQEQMQRAQAASGTLGSSVGQENMADAITGLRAQQAMQGANFNLQAAGQADQALMAQLGLGGQLAGGMQQLGESRATGGMNAALAAQDARRARGQDMYGNVYAPSAAMAGMVGNSMDQMLAGDKEMMDAAMAAEMGLSREQLNQSYAKADRQKQDELHSAEMAKNIYGFAGGGGGGGGMGGMMGGGG